MREAFELEEGKLETLENVIYTALINSGITGKRAWEIAKGARIVAVGSKLTFPWIRGVILVLNVEGPSFFCVNCGSRHIYGLDVIIATDPEMRELSGNRIIVYGICEECLAKHDVEYFEDRIIKLLKRNDVRGVRVG